MDSRYYYKKAIILFYTSCESNNLSLVQKLYIEHRFDASILDKAFIKCCINGCLETAKYLLENGADVSVHDNYAIKFAITKKDLCMVILTYLYGAHLDPNDYTLIGCAAYNGDLKMAKYLVACGANIRANNNFAIKIAVKNSHFEVAKYLMDNGADYQVVRINYFKFCNYLLLNSNDSNKSEIDN